MTALEISTWIWPYLNNQIIFDYIENKRMTNLASENKQYNLLSPLSFENTFWDAFTWNDETHRQQLRKYITFYKCQPCNETTFLFCCQWMGNIFDQFITELTRLNLLDKIIAIDSNSNSSYDVLEMPDCLYNQQLMRLRKQYYNQVI